jgi:hypothetical protein
VDLSGDDHELPGLVEMIEAHGFAVVLFYTTRGKRTCLRSPPWRG